MKFPDVHISDLETLKSFFDDETDKIERITSDELLARMFGVIMFFNSINDQQKASLLDKIIKYLRKLKEKLDGIAKNWGVSSYSIGVHAPFGIDVSLTFEPQ